MRSIIVAVSPERLIGIGSAIPWRYPADLARFKRLTTGHTVIMGRKTYASIGRPLPNRTNRVVTRQEIAGVACHTSLEAAIAASTGDIWFIGGAAIYQEAMRWADQIDVTYVPDRFADRLSDPESVFFPEIGNTFEPGPRIPHEDDPRLERQVFTRTTR